MRIPKALKALERRRDKLLLDLTVQQGGRTGYMREEVAALAVALEAMEEKRLRVHEARAERMRDEIYMPKLPV